VGDRKSLPPLPGHTENLNTMGILHQSQHTRVGVREIIDEAFDLIPLILCFSLGRRTPRLPEVLLKALDM